MIKSIPRFQAHRGYHLDGQFHENSISSVERAAELGLQMAEVDLRMTADGQIVLFHDQFFIGQDSCKYRLSDMSYSEINKSLKLDLLRDLLRVSKGKIFLNLEIKSESFLNRDICEEVLNTIDYVGNHEILISSFNPLVLRNLRSSKKIQLAILQGDKSLPFHLECYFHFCYRRVFDWAHFEHSLVTAKMIEFFKKQEVSIAVWTVNNQSKFAELFAMGVASIITDNPPLPKR